MINCPNCNTPNEEGLETCTNCGAPLFEPSTSSVSPAVAGIPSEYLETPQPSREESQGQPSPAASPSSRATQQTTEKPSPAGGVALPPPHKDRSLAIILEILPGLFGFLGIGWIYSGNVTVGLALLIGYLIWNIIAITLVVVTAGVACLCILPINILALIVSVLLLNSYIRDNSSSLSI